MKTVIVYDKSIPYLINYFSKLKLGQFSLIAKTKDQIKNKEIPSDTKILIIRSNILINKEFLSNTKIKVICTASSGVNHIDSQVCEKQSIRIIHAKSANAVAVADYVVSTFFSVSNNINQINYKMGIVGLGNIGKLVYKRFSKLGYSCCAYDPFVEKDKTLNSKYKFTTYEDVLKCDIVTFHVPLTYVGQYPTSHMLNRNNLYLIRSGTILINSCRGGVIDESALLERMENKNDLKLIIDVWENEPYIDRALVKYVKVGTPHIAGWSKTARRNIAAMLYEKLLKHLQLSGEKFLIIEKVMKANNLKYFFDTNALSLRNYLILLALQVPHLNTTSHLFKQFMLATDMTTNSVFTILQNNYKNRNQLSDVTIMLPDAISKNKNLFLAFNIRSKIDNINSPKNLVKLKSKL